MRNEYEVRRSAKVIGEFMTEDEARRFASQFHHVAVEVWRRGTRTRPAELVAEYGGRAA